MEEFDCDIAHILENRDFNVFGKLSSLCSNFRKKIAAKVENAIEYEIQCMQKRTQSANKISELQQEVENLKSEIDATKLQQKIVDKKIINAVKQQEKLKEEVHDAELKRDSLTLEMVDLQQESEKRKEHKILTWNAIKRVCQIYKQYLDFHIRLINNKEHEQIKISLFIKDTATRDKYFVVLVHSNNQWKVEEIQPMLKAEHLSNFKGIVDFSKESEISNINAFLCKLRHVFLKYYLNTE
ncbi:hypothetical protein WH47_05486 [Habropoda laboriosa]|uniref:Kinetochore protein SPC25 n=1 Tax=Habropoda laboriosa TaxID=597456 RepID=A0A0L7RFD9_9HYME|nr:PREDICTED: uncharacterized protein LOC108578703 [Habropoda laboriosa]KOC69543.1 hypothetical protein WH47_05486 [Habropoda laboriosa]